MCSHASLLHSQSATLLRLQLVTLHSWIECFVGPLDQLSQPEWNWLRRRAKGPSLRQQICCLVWTRSVSGEHTHTYVYSGSVHPMRWVLILVVCVGWIYCGNINIWFFFVSACQVALRDIHLSLAADPPQHTKSNLLLRKLRCLIKENAQNSDIVACTYVHMYVCITTVYNCTCYQPYLSAITSALRCVKVAGICWKGVIEQGQKFVCFV